MKLEAISLNTSPERLAVLATDKISIVRWRVAQNPNTPHFIKKHFKHHKYLQKLKS